MKDRPTAKEAYDKTTKVLEAYANGDLLGGNPYCHIEKYAIQQESGWIRIEDDLPKMLARDLLNGGTEILVANKAGNIDIGIVSDHNVWYHLAQNAGVTHWMPLPPKPTE